MNDPTVLVETIRKLLHTSYKEFVPKLRFLVDNILITTLKEGKVCKLSHDLIPKLFVYENTDLYTEFLNFVKTNNTCMDLYKLNVKGEFDEFLYFSLSFITYVFLEIDNKDLIISTDFKENTIRIIRNDVFKQLIDNNFNLEDDIDIGNISLNITIH